MPAELRLTDREELPRLRLPVPGSGDQAVVKQALDDYVQEWKDFGIAEEIRLGYVAVTRARHLLLCSGSWWRDGKTVVRPVVAADHRAGRLRGRRGRDRRTGPSRRRTTRPTRRWRSGRSGSGRPTR